MRKSLRGKMFIEIELNIFPAFSHYFLSVRHLPRLALKLLIVAGYLSVNCLFCLYFRLCASGKNRDLCSNRLS